VLTVIVATALDVAVGMTVEGVTVQVRVAGAVQDNATGWL
jgi:hypothetical protein